MQEKILKKCILCSKGMRLAVFELEGVEFAVNHVDG